MKIGAGALAERPFEHHLVALNRRKSGHKKNMIVGLTLTSMVDMFSLLVIFLLQTFSASPEVLVMGKGLTLPMAMTASEPKDALALSISGDGLYVDQKKIGEVEELLKDPTPFMKALEEHKDRWMQTHPTEAFKGEVSLIADRETPSSTISMFMGMLPSMSYGSIQLAVISGGI